MTVKFAPVCPIHILEHLYESSANEQNAIGDYFLLLAHDVLANKQRYRDFFETLRAEGDITIIMDNSVIELGTSCTSIALKEACDVVNADVLVIPDELLSGAKTSVLAENFLNEWPNYVSKEDGKIPELMFVPQGDHRSQYEICASNAAEFFMPHIKWIGIARNLTGRIYRSRMEAIDFLDTLFPEAKFHMLGFSDDADDDLKTCAVYADRLEGIDSAVPLRITEDLKHPIQDVGKRGTWWDDVQPTEQQVWNTLEMRKRLGEIQVSDEEAVREAE